MKTLTTQEAAGRLGVSVRRVNELITSGRLPAERFGRAHVIREEDLKLVEDRKPGRPPKPQPEATNGRAAKPVKKAPAKKRAKRKE